MLLKKAPIITLKDINEFLFVMEAQCVFCEVWSQFCLVNAV